MAKWSLKHQGQSGHIHMSLNNAQGENVFYNYRKYTWRGGLTFDEIFDQQAIFNGADYFHNIGTGDAPIQYQPD